MGYAKCVLHVTATMTAVVALVILVAALARVRARTTASI